MPVPPDTTTTVALTYLQVYRKSVTDLLGEDLSRSLRVRVQPDGGVSVEGASRHPVSSAAQVARLIRKGSKNRKTVGTLLNSTSSRSHAVLTFHITHTAPTAGAAAAGASAGAGAGAQEEDLVSEAKINVVDLAGSERVGDSGVAGDNLRDAASINLSLFHLAGVVSALGTGKKRVPYKSNKLCMLLKDALGGDSRTTLVATVSPAQRHARETLGTLRFATSCGRVTNTVVAHSRRVVHQRPWAERTKPKPKPKGPPPLPWAGARLGSDRCPGGRLRVVTKRGELSCLAYGDRGAPLALCLHGHPSSAEQGFGDWLLPALVHAGYYAVALDMPGRGHSPGSALRTRSELALDRGGAADVVLAFLDAMGHGHDHGRPVAVIGYDWGGGIALSMAASRRHRQSVSHIVCFHPSYHEAAPGDLRKVGSNTMVVWCKQDQFHSWSKWRKLAGSLKQSLGERKYDEFIFNERLWGTHGWSKFVPDIERRIVKFLTGQDPVLEAEVVAERPQAPVAATDGREVMRRDNIVFAEDAASGAAGPKSLFQRRDPGVEAVQALRSAMEAATLPGAFAAIMGGAGPARQAAVALFSALPPIGPEQLQDPEYPVAMGAWQRAPTGWHAMRQSPRYFPGRQVLVRAQVDPRPASGAGFLRLAAAAGGPAFTTPRAWFLGPCPRSDQAGQAMVELDGPGGRSIQTLPMAEILRCNQPQLLPARGGSSTSFHLEDGVYVDYDDSLTRAKLWQAALRLAPIAAAIDFDEPEEALALQLEAVREVRRAIDMVTFQRDESGQIVPGGNYRQRGRYCGDRAGRFAAGGQGHCHTVTSVMTAFLLPWSTPLGLEVKFRGGHHFAAPDGSGAAAEVLDRPETHQWVEFTCRPSMRTFACDLFVEDGCGDEALLTVPALEAYTTFLYPQCRLHRFSGFPVTTDPLSATDLVEEEEEDEEAGLGDAAAGDAEEEKDSDGHDDEEESGEEDEEES